MFNLIVFLGGVGLGSFGTLMILWLLSQQVEAEVMTKEDFERFKVDWESSHDEYGAYEGATSSEMFLDLEDEEWPSTI